MYKGPLDVQSLSACSFFVFLFSFSSNPLLPLSAEGGNWWNALFPPTFMSIGSVGGEIPIPGVQEQEKRKVRRFWGGHERISKEKQKKSERRSDYCCGERAWVTSLSRRKDEQVINAAGRRLRTSSGFCSTHTNNTVWQPSQSGQTLTHIWASAQPLMKEQGSKWWRTSIT